MKTSFPHRAASLVLTAVALALASPRSRAQEAHDNVVVVLDSSGSMADNMRGVRLKKMDAAKTALKQVLQKLRPNVHVGLLVFGANGLPSDWVYPLGPRDDARLVPAIDQLQPGGGTPLGAYIKKGADRLLDERAKQFGYGTFRLLIVTDGEAQDQKLVDSYTPEVMSRGITIDVIGVAMNQRHTLATKVHSYRTANDSASLQKALTEVFAEVGEKSDDTADADVFSALEPIPPQLAGALIQALSTSENQPIGQSPVPPPAPAVPPSATPDSAAPVSAVPPPSPAGMNPPASAPAPPPSPSPDVSGFPLIIGGVIGLFFFGIVAAIILAFVIRMLKRPRR